MPNDSASRLGEIVGGELDAGFLAVGGLADDLDDLVEVRQRDEVAFQRFGPALRLAQVEAGAAHARLRGGARCSS